MKTKRYLPDKDKERGAWIKQFALKLSPLAATIGVTAAEVTATNNDSAYYNYALDVANIFKKEAKERNKYKDILGDGPVVPALGPYPSLVALPIAPAAVAPGIFIRIALLVQRIKKHPAYTNAMGVDLGIIGADDVLDKAAMKPILKLLLGASGVLVKWTKGAAHAIRIEADRGTGWTFLAVDTEPDYLDTTPITAPATWKYRAVYLISDEIVGQWSDEAKIAVGA